MASRPVEWTPEMDSALLFGTLAGDGYRPLSKRIGVAKSIIQKRRRQLGIGMGKSGYRRKEKSA